MNEAGAPGQNDLKKYLASLASQQKSILVAGDFNKFKEDIVNYLVHELGFTQTNFDPTQYQKGTGKKFLNDICFGLNIDVKLVHQVKNNW